jgi:phosphoribosylglycinamide formyltransferase-1
MNYAFYVSGNASRLIKILQLPNSKTSIFIPKVKTIIYDGTNQEVVSKMKNLIKPYEIGITLVDYKSLNLTRKEESNYISELIINKFNQHLIDYFFCFGDRILRPKLINEHPNKIINFHPSLLPAFPGLNAIDQALKANTLLLGNTAHFIDESIDSGLIIQQSYLPKAMFNDYEDVLKLQVPMFLQIFLWLEANRITTENNCVLIKSAKYSLQSQFTPALEL